MRGRFINIYVLALSLSAFALAACSSFQDLTLADASLDSGRVDGSLPLDASTTLDATIPADALVPIDSGTLTDAADDDAPLDASVVSCTSDQQCAPGAEWCVDGACVPCSNAGLVCRILCPSGWSIYTRNGCHPCACAPVNECGKDTDCDDGESCYAGAACPDWCAPGDPSCCYGGNHCRATGCTGSYPAGCSETGCPDGKVCNPSGCGGGGSCTCGLDGNFACTRDCRGRCEDPV
jgi:hypothetical protein